MPSAPTRARPFRWAIALLVTIAVLVATTGVAVFAQTGSAGGPAFAPASSVAWVEVRLDLPGNQEEQLSELLGHLPGFADPAALDTKIDELLDQVVSQASDGAASWTGDIDPWSNRQLGLALLEIPASAGGQPGDDDDDDDDDHDGPPPLVIGLGVKDRAALEARIAAFLPTDDVTTEQYQGTTVTTVDDDVSFAVTDQYLLVSPDADDVKASLDVLAGRAPSLAENPDFAAAAERIPADRLGAFYFALSALRPLLESQLSRQPGTQAVLDMLDQLPAWVSGYAQAASDHLTVALDMQAPASLPLPGMRETDLAARFPSGTLAYLEMRDLGRTVHAALEQLLAQVPTDDAADLAQLEQMLGTPIEGILDPVEDAALGVSFSAGLVQAGIVATLSDPAAAQTRVTSLLALARILATRAGATVSDSQVDGVNVTTIMFPEGSMGRASLPITPSVSVALSGDRLYLGLGDFVEDALTQDPATSLASDARFEGAVTAAGSPNSGFAWVDIAGAQTVFETIGPADAAYRTNVKPWLDALDSLVISSAVDADAISAKVLLFVR